MPLDRTTLSGLGFCLLVTFGCNPVTSRHPVGTEPLQLEAPEWEGTWSNPEGSLEVRIVDAKAGQLEAAWIELEEDGFELETLEVHLLRGGGALFASVRENPTEDPDYLIALIDKEENQILIWWPDGDKFKRLVEDGQLPGEVSEDGAVTLGKLEPQHLTLLTSEEHETPFQWRKPGVLFRRPSR